MSDSIRPRPGRWQRRPAGIRPVRIALVGADGAGKSTISRMLESSELPFPVKRIYMGVNLDASTDMLPTTRLLFGVKGLLRRLDSGPLRRRSPAPRGPQNPGEPQPGTASAGRPLKDAGRLVTWMTEEWLRQLLAASYTRRGYIVIFDRHFFADYHSSDQLVRSAASSSPLSRLHRWMLEHLYPRPDLVVCLDAPADVLWARKREDSIEWLEARRQQYLRLSGAVPAFSVVDVDRPLAEVYPDVVRAIHDYYGRSPSTAA